MDPLGLELQAFMSLTDVGARNQTQVLFESGEHPEPDFLASRLVSSLVLLFKK